MEKYIYRTYKISKRFDKEGNPVSEEELRKIDAMVDKMISEKIMGIPNETP